jgi:hypothetical protein
MVNKEHLTMEGLVKIANIKASMNFVAGGNYALLGTISETIRSLIPTAIEPVKRPVTTNIKIYNPN